MQALAKKGNHLRNPPKRWSAYPALGTVLDAARIVAFKVPLAEQVFLQPVRFTPDDVIDQLRQTGVELGLVIDLTNTDRYYEPESFTSKGIRHVKIMCRGHTIPYEEDYQRFEGEVERFLATDPHRVVGVHCTHGINRTGYMICRYMISKQKLSSEKALALFETARPPGIQREVYIERLHALANGSAFIRTSASTDGPCR